METSLQRDIYEGLKLLWAGETAREFSVDCVIPDIMPDAESVVDVEGMLLLRSKETEQGIVTLTASVHVSVLYIPEDGGALRSLAASIPVELRPDAPGVDTDCRTVSQLRLRALDARMLNSRKLAVRADVEAAVRTYRKEVVELASALESSAEVHIRTESAACVQDVDVREKTFVITDDYALPVGISGVESILSQRVESSIEDAKFVSGKVVFRGRMRVNLLLAGTEPGQVIPARYETEFSQIMEVDGDGDVTPEVSICFTGVYFDLPDRSGESGRIAAELHMAAQCICRKATELTYIADLYSNRTALLPENETVELVDSVRRISMHQTVTDRAEPFVGDGEVISVAAAIGGISVENEAVKTVVNIRLLCRGGDGRYSLSRCRLGAEFTVDGMEGAALQGISVSVADVYYSATSGGADVRATLQLEAQAVRAREILCVADIREDQEAWAREKPMPSMTLVRVPRGTDMWTLAKKYRSATETIAAVNGEKEAGLFLIPKSR